jgi:hypothetical protein
MDTPGIKRPRREADHSPVASAEVKKMWIYTPTPAYAFMAWCCFTCPIFSTGPAEQERDCGTLCLKKLDMIDSVENNCRF